MVSSARLAGCSDPAPGIEPGLAWCSPCKATVSALLPGSVPRLPAHWRLPDSCLESTRLRAVLSFAFVLNYKISMLRARVRAL